MEERKYVVPEGMLDAATQATTTYAGKISYPPYIECALESALRWLAENPIVPSYEQVQSMRDDYNPEYQPGSHVVSPSDMRHGAVEWQRRMFLAPTS